MRRAVLLLVSPFAFSACFTSTADFKDDAETFIVENDQLRDALAIGFTSATCEEPPRQDVGTEFTCTALDEQGQSWEFIVEITGSAEYEVNVNRRP